MNTLDLMIIAVLALSCISGLYYGFLRSVFSLAATGVSIYAAYLYSPRVSAWIYRLPDIKATLAGYMDAVVRVGDFDLAKTRVQGMGQGVVDAVLNSVRLPGALSELLKNNLQAVNLQQHGAATVNDYVQNTIVSGAISVVSFIVTFFLCYLALRIVLSVLSNIFRFPVLKQLNSVLGGALGLVRGGIIVCVLLLVLPFVQTLLPKEVIDPVVAGSKYASFFSSLPLFFRVAGL